MALVNTMKWSCALVWLATSLIACSELDPVSVESLCEGPGPVREECPQCQGPEYASECPQCQQSPADESCLPPNTSEGTISGEPGVDGGTSSTEGGEGGAGASDPQSSNGDGSQAGNGDGSQGSAGDGSTPPEGNAGEDGSGQPPGQSGQPGQPGQPGQQPQRGCVEDVGCPDSALPACHPGGFCTECLRNEHCGEGRQCDSPRNLCVQCVDNSGCEALGQVCNVNARTCIECLGNADCTDPAAPACTPANQCVACTQDSFCPEEAPACDAMACYECKSDQYCNSPGKHACIEAEHRCVECETDAHCRGEGDRAHCLVEANSCVQCLTNADCSDTSASHCDSDTHTCVECTGTADCSGFASTAPRCVEGKGCVACDANDGICGDKACILSQNVCSTTDRQSVGACGQCVTRDECITGHVCVNVKFGSYDTGDFCLPNLPDFRTCPRPFGREIPNVMTLDGDRVQTLCALPETTTCQAMLDTVADKTCNDNNAACGLGRSVLGTNDGVCTTACTYNCSDDKFCPNGMVCSEEQAVCL
jgi:hypothetical protein